MHPSKEKLRRYADGTSNQHEASLIEKHTSVCGFCREFVKEYQLLAQSVAEASAEPLPECARAQAESLYRQALRGLLVAMTPLSESMPEQPIALAADGASRDKSDLSLENLTTLYSEDPEIVLRVMRDRSSNQDYLQLISESAEAVDNVLVQIPSLGREYLTDSKGWAELDKVAEESLNDIKWQIKMPDAVFDLEPLVYDPDRTEYSKQVDLETENNDQIRVTFEGKTEGKQVSLEILRLDGSVDFGSIKVTISHDESQSIMDAHPNQPIRFDLAESQSVVKIRLFQQK